MGFFQFKYIYIFLILMGFFQFLNSFFLSVFNRFILRYNQKNFLNSLKENQIENTKNLNSKTNSESIKK